MRRSQPSRRVRHHDLPAYAGWRPFVVGVTAIWLVCFLAVIYGQWSVSPRPSSQWIRAFGLSPYNAFVRLEVWRVFTSAALHDSFLHLLVNTLCVIAAGGVVARRLGAKRAIVYALAGVVAGGVVAGAVGLLIPAKAAIGGTGLMAGLMGVYLIVCRREFIYLGRRVGVSYTTVAMVMFFCAVAGSAIGGRWLNPLQGAGAFGGALCFYLEAPLTRWLTAQRTKRRQRLCERDEEMRIRLDAILARIHDKGIESLGRVDRGFLRTASQRLRDINRRAARPPSRTRS